MIYQQPIVWCLLSFISFVTQKFSNDQVDCHFRSHIPCREFHTRWHI